MAGMGKRLRPHTLITPKPLVKIAGKPIVEWIIEEINSSLDKKFDEVHFIIGNFGKKVEEDLIQIAKRCNAKGFIHYQLEALGTAHAIYCAKEALNGEVMIAFADTLFQGKFVIEEDADAIIWTMKVPNPESYGVVTTDDNNFITGFVEKPKEPVSNNAIIGIYYFRKAEKLNYEVTDLVENNRKENNEFQLTNCLEDLRLKGERIKCGTIDEWLDCGNRDELLITNKRLIEIKNLGVNGLFINGKTENENVSFSGINYIEDNCSIKNSRLENCIIYDNCIVENCDLTDSIIGNKSKVKGLKGKADFSQNTSYETID